MSKGNTFTYAAEPVRCHACAARDKKAESFHKQGGESHGLMFTINKESDGR